MNLKKILRLAIIIDWVLAILGIVVSEILESKLPSQLQDYIQWQADQPLTTIEHITFIPIVLLLLAYLVTSIGLFFYKPWAKNSYIAVGLLMIALYPFTGPVVDHAASAAIGEISTTIFGFIIALLIFTNVYKTEDTKA